ncbi:hypothetical protein ACWDOP_01120 [Nocardia sp. NPDC003693]
MIYEERHGFTAKTVLLLVGLAVLTLSSVLLSDGVGFLTIAGIALFGSGFVMILLNSLSRKVAIRVDQDGITLGGPPLDYQKQTQRVAWNDVAVVALWRDRTGIAGGLKIGVLRISAPHPETRAQKGMVSFASAITGAPDERLLHCTQSVDGWHLDTGALKSALRAFAPHVRFYDHR